MQVPSLSMFEAIFSIPTSDAFTELGDDSRWPAYMQNNQSCFRSHLRAMRDDRPAGLWALMRASIANRLTIYYTNTQGDYGFRIGSKDQTKPAAGEVWFMAEFQRDRSAVLRICPSHPSYAAGGLNSTELFDGMGLSELALFWIKDLERRAGSAPQILALLDDTCFVAANFINDLTARYLPIAHPVNGFSTVQEASAYRRNWLNNLRQ